MLAVGALGTALAVAGVSSGALRTGDGPLPELPLADGAAALSGTPPTATLSAAEADRLAARRAVVSRSDRRDDSVPAKAEVLAVDESPAATVTEDLSDEDPRTIALALLPEYGFSTSEFDCLDALYVSESNWRVDADNPSTSAYGIPQAMTSVHDMPADYFTSAEAQIRWGLEYIQGAYGTPCSAWGFKQSNGWY